MKSKHVGVGAILVILVLLVGYYLTTTANKSANDSNTSGEYTPAQDTPVLSQPPQEVDFTARFSIRTNGIQRVFTAAMYHNLSDEVYIESSDPGLIHVKQNGVTWSDFFSTLPFKLTEDCLTTGDGDNFCTGQQGTLQFYLNGERDENPLEKIIRPDDSLVVTFGS